MPKDEFDFEDPLELNGVAFLTEEDTSVEMTECFAEEFMRMGYNPKQVLALFRNPNYSGPNMVLQNKGEPFVREIISGIFARWGRPFTGLPLSSGTVAETQGADQPDAAAADKAGPEPRADLARNPIDPMGNPAPELNI